MRVISHALVLNLHQPAGNLDRLLGERAWEAREILQAIDRIPRVLWPYEDVARVHLALSGTLLETLSSPPFQARAYGTVDCGSLLWHLQNLAILRILGTAYYHPVMPLLAPQDREEHVRRWLGIGRHLLGRPAFHGFWPPEMGFSMDMIPLLRRHGYEYVLVDSAHVEPETALRWEELRYRPHLARCGGEQIVVIVRDRELSDAQQSGMDFQWFARETAARTKGCDFPPLVTTCTDGDNGGWFRNPCPDANFWGRFYGPLLEHARAPAAAVRPAFIEDYLRAHGAFGYVTVRTGAWNTGWHHGRDFAQWTGTSAQRDALERARTLSGAVHGARRQVLERGAAAPETDRQLEASLWPLLRAETSCNFFWGDAWVSRAHADLDRAEAELARLRPALGIRSRE